MITLQELLPIGHFTKPHGKVGEIACALDNDNLATVLESVTPSFVVLLLDNIFVPFSVIQIRGKNADTALFTLEDINSEERAQRLCSAPAYLLRKELPSDFEEELTYGDLVGYAVHTTSGKVLGTIRDIDDSTINTLIALDNGLILPLHDDFIVEADPDTHILILNLPKGLG